MRWVTASVGGLLALAVLAMFTVPGWVGWTGLTAGSCMGWAYGRIVFGRR